MSKRVTVAFLAEQVVKLTAEVERLRGLVEGEGQTDVIGFKVEQDDPDGPTVPDET